LKKIFEKVMAKPIKYRKITKVNAKWTDKETAQLCDILTSLPDALTVGHIEDLQKYFSTHSLQSLRCKIKALREPSLGIFILKLNISLLSEIIKHNLHPP